MKEKGLCYKLSRTVNIGYLVKLLSNHQERPKLKSVTEFGIRETGIPNSQIQKIYMMQIIKELKPNKKTKEENKEKELNI